MKQRRRPNSFWMIKLNYFVRFVAFQIGSGQGRLGFCWLLHGVWLHPPPPSHSSDKQIPRSSFFGGGMRARPRKEEKAGKVGNAFIRHPFRLSKSCCCTPASHCPVSPPTSLSAKAPGKGGKGRRIKRKRMASERWEVLPRRWALRWPSAKENEVN